MTELASDATTTNPTINVAAATVPARQRVRFTYEKGEAIKFISHQDEFRLWERTLRRADLPLLYKQGFNPQPHIQFASPLGVGITGANELIDITFSPPLPLPQLCQRIREKLPPGVCLHDAHEVPLKTPALQSLLIGADYTIRIYAEPGEIDEDALHARLANFLASPESWRVRERKGKPYRYNLRPLVLELHYKGYSSQDEEHRIFLRVQQLPGATGRPDEVVAALEFEDYARTLCRDRLYFSNNEEDVAIFAQYPTATKEDIGMAVVRGKNQGNKRPQKQKRRRQKQGNDNNTNIQGKPPKSGRSISERAADEFV